MDFELSKSSARKCFGHVRYAVAGLKGEYSEYPIVSTQNCLSSWAYSRSPSWPKIVSTRSTASAIGDSSRSTQWYNDVPDGEYSGVPSSPLWYSEVLPRTRVYPSGASPWAAERDRYGPAAPDQFYKMW